MNEISVWEVVGLVACVIFGALGAAVARVLYARWRR